MNQLELTPLTMEARENTLLGKTPWQVRFCLHSIYISQLIEHWFYRIAWACCTVEKSQSAFINSQVLATLRNTTEDIFEWMQDYVKMICGHHGSSQKKGSKSNLACLFQFYICFHFRRKLVDHFELTGIFEHVQWSLTSVFCRECSPGWVTLFCMSVFIGNLWLFVKFIHVTLLAGLI